jgi:hypothetical protein
MIEALSVVAIFILVCSIYKWMTGYSVFRKRPRWDAEQEYVLEAAQFSSYRNRLTESALPHIKGDTMDFHAQPFALDAEPPVWADRRPAA